MLVDRCNNAKTDNFTEEEYIKVGKVFKEIWDARLKGNNNFYFY
jgi:hypothetical protein